MNVAADAASASHLQRRTLLLPLAPSPAPPPADVMRIILNDGILAA